jgi:hypothetical protein
MGLFTKRRQDAPLTEFLRGNLLFCDFADQERQERFNQNVGGVVPDFDRALFEWLVLDTAVIATMLNNWSLANASEFRRQITSELWSVCATFLVERFPALIDEGNFRQVLSPRMTQWEALLSGDLRHQNGPGWVIAKAYAKYIGEDDNLVLILFASQIVVKITHFEKTLKEMKQYRIVAG